MIHNDEATLVTLTASGATVTKHETDVFCGRKSVGFREFYAAIQAGLNPTYIFEMDVDEYESACITDSTTQARSIPTELLYRGARYNIIRTYEPTDGTIEVTVGL